MRVIEIAAYVAESEKPLASRAAEQIARAISVASGESSDCRCSFIESLDDVVRLEKHAIVVASLLRDVDDTESWNAIEQRLRAGYAALAEREVPAFLCTVFRHVGTGGDAAAAERLLRIRRLNLLAMELSRLTGAYVIDLDRAFADIGGVRLGTDYLLRGRLATEQGAYAIASSVVADGLDAFVSVDVANGATAILDSTRPATGSLERSELTQLPSAVPTYGRRSPSVKPVLVTVQASRVDAALRNVLRGSIGPREIGARLLQAMRQRGVRTTTKLLAVGLAKRLRARR